jgi:hypothetical protein
VIKLSKDKLRRARFCQEHSPLRLGPGDVSRACVRNTFTTLAAKASRTGCTRATPRNARWTRWKDEGTAMPFVVATDYAAVHPDGACLSFTGACARPDLGKLGDIKPGDIDKPAIVKKASAPARS